MADLLLHIAPWVWDGRRKLAVRSPYSRIIIERLKRLPKSQRTWIGKLRIWVVDEQHAQAVKDWLTLYAQGRCECWHGRACETWAHIDFDAIGLGVGRLALEREEPKPRDPAAAAAALLGVRLTATADAIKFAARKMALREHPDVGGSHERMVAVNHARDVLLGRVK